MGHFWETKPSSNHKSGLKFRVFSLGCISSCAIVPNHRFPVTKFMLSQDPNTNLKMPDHPHLNGYTTWLTITRTWECSTALEVGLSIIPNKFTKMLNFPTLNNATFNKEIWTIHVKVSTHTHTTPYHTHTIPPPHARTLCSHFRTFIILNSILIVDLENFV